MEDAKYFKTEDGRGPRLSSSSVERDPNMGSP